MKRAFDVVVSAGALIVLMPLLLLLGVVVRVWIGSPVLFRQRRPGRQGVLFELVKLRTMTEERGADGELLPDVARLTRAGRLLRAASLDELPELWNVLRGEMSLVGPRPLLPEYLPLYSARQARRHDVRPGITGWAQINGRNAVDWDSKLEMDVWYVEHANFWLDLRILWRTLVQVVRREGISAPGHATMPRFTGSGSSTN